MPVKLQTVFHTLMYEYAKLIADRTFDGRDGTVAAARTGSAYWSFVTRIFTKLKKGDLHASSILRENKLFVS